MLDALNAKRSGNSWTAKCPAHDDHNHSLSVSVGADGKILFHCHKGCAQQAVQDALKRLGVWGQSSIRVENPVYTYVDERGAPLHRVTRLPNKQFPQEHFAGGQWMKGLNGAQTVLYHLDEIVESVR